MELLEHPPGPSQLGMGGEEGFEANLFGLAQAVGSAQSGVP